MKPMYRLVMISVLVPFVGAVAKDRGGDFAACRKGRAEVASKIPDFHGDAQIKRLIAADVTRAEQEEAEGDADECLEAIDHAHKLMDGKY